MRTFSKPVWPQPQIHTESSRRTLIPSPPQHIHIPQERATIGLIPGYRMRGLGPTLIGIAHPAVQLDAGTEEGGSRLRQALHQGHSRSLDREHCFLFAAGIEVGDGASAVREEGKLLGY